MPKVTLTFRRVREEVAEYTFDVSEAVAARLAIAKLRQDPDDYSTGTGDKEIDTWAKYTIGPMIPRENWRPTQIETVFPARDYVWRIENIEQ
jgi:hypothetical protein